MNKNKSIKKIIIVIVLSTCLNWLRTFIIEQVNMQSVTELLNGVTLPAIIIVVALLVATFAFLGYKTPALSVSEYEKKVKEYIFSSFTTEQLATVSAMSEEEQVRFLEEMKKLQSPEASKTMTTALSKYHFASEPSNLRFPKRLVRLALVALLLFTGYSTYTKVEVELKGKMGEHGARMNEVINDQILYIEGLPPIQLLSNNTFKKVRIDEYIEHNIKTQPSYLLNNATMITLCNEDIYSAYGREDWSAGFAEAFSMQAFICIDRNSDTVVYHELSHLYDFSNEMAWLSDSPEFQTLWTQYKDTMSYSKNDDYFKQNVIEFFAESSAYYVTDGDNLRRQSKPLYNYFERLYGQ